MSADTVASRIALRRANDDDREFLIEVYASTRNDLSLVPLDEEQCDALVRMQYHAQDVHYRQTHPNASFDVVEHDGKPAGRLYVDRSAADIRIIDVTLLPEHRGSGIGTSLIQSVLDDAAATGRTVSLHLTVGNRAARLYERLAFRPSADLGVYRLLEWRAP